MALPSFPALFTGVTIIVSERQGTAGLRTLFQAIMKERPSDQDGHAGHLQGEQKAIDHRSDPMAQALARGGAGKVACAA